MRNQVIAISSNESIAKPQPGDIYVNIDMVNKNHVEYYILSVTAISTRPKYAAVSLNDGQMWDVQTSMIEEAIIDLSLYKRNTKIMIE